MNANDVNLLRVAAHCLFDGWISKSKSGAYTIGYANKNKVLIDEFSNAIIDLTGIRPYRQIRINATEITFSNKKLFNDILNIITLNKYFRDDFYQKLISDKRLIKIVLRAFWDDEGMVGFYSHKSYITRKLRARCQNEQLRKQLLELHQILGVNSHEEYDKKGIIVTDRNSIEKFSLRINFTNGLKVLKSNGIKSVWKGKNKTHILKLLLESYKN